MIIMISMGEVGFQDRLYVIASFATPSKMHKYLEHESDFYFFLVLFITNNKEIFTKHF